MQLSSAQLQANKLQALSRSPRLPTPRRHLLKVMSTSAEPKGSSSKTEIKLIGPEPKRFTVAPGQLLTIASAAFPFLARLGSGGFVLGYRTRLPAEQPGKYAVLQAGGRAVEESSALIGSLPRPAKPLELYEFEGCPFCRKVREAVCILDLDVLFYPCPKKGPTWRPKAVEMGGKPMFPYLVDPNTGKAMYESDDIIRYLFETYGGGSSNIPLSLRLGFLTALTCGLGLAPRGAKGSFYTPSKVPEQPLVYWGYELSPFCKVVREKLSELEIPHLYHSVARGSPKRQVPYIEDPNTGVAMFESAAIVKYLDETYGAGTA
ncbi:hypothetical protein N2152v2_003973 [Parachlorella kessleri]